MRARARPDTRALAFEIGGLDMDTSKIASLLKTMSEMGETSYPAHVRAQLNEIAYAFEASGVLVLLSEQKPDGPATTLLYSEPAGGPDFLASINEAMKDTELTRVLGQRGCMSLSQFAGDGAFRRVLQTLAGSGDAYVVPVGDEASTLGVVVFAGPALKLTPFSRAILFIAGYAALTHTVKLAVSPDQATNTLGNLSEREAECLHWLSSGKVDSEISTILGISPRTVRIHMDSVKAKMGVTSRVQAVAKALRR